MGMMMLNRLWIISGLVTAVSIFAGGYWLGQTGGLFRAKVTETARSTVTERKLERDEQRHAVVVTERTRTTKKPDGTIVTDVIAIKAVKEQSISQNEHETVHETVITKTDNRPNWRVSVLMPPKWPVTDYRDISVGVSRRVLGPVSIEAQVGLGGALLIGVGVEF